MMEEYSLEDLDLLEKRVHELIQQLKDLKGEKRALEAQLSEQAESFLHLQQERAEVRGRVEKILGTLNHLGEDLNDSVIEQQEQAPEQTTPY